MPVSQASTQIWGGEYSTTSFPRTQAGKGLQAQAQLSRSPYLFKLRVVWILPCLILWLRSGCSLSLRQNQSFHSLRPAIFLCQVYE